MDRKKSLVGWVWTNNPVIKFDANHKFAQLQVADIYKTRQGIIFAENITKKREYLYSIKQVRITIEELPQKKFKNRRGVMWILILVCSCLQIPIFFAHNNIALRVGNIVFFILGLIMTRFAYVWEMELVAQNQ